MGSQCRQFTHEEGKRDRERKMESINKIPSWEIRASKRRREGGRRIQAWEIERGRQEDEEECGWEREGLRRDRKRQTEDKREWSILEP